VDILELFTTDQELEKAGVWVEIGSAGEKIRVARMYNPAYSARLREVMEPYKQKVSKTNNDESLEIMISIEAETILLDWEGFTENGQDVPYSRDKAKQYLRLKDFRALVNKISSNMETFKAQQVEESEKN